MPKTAQSYLHSSGHNTEKWRTDRQKWSSYYSALHCQQCRRAVKSTRYGNFTPIPNLYP